MKQIERTVTLHTARVHGITEHGEGLVMHDGNEIILPFCLPGEIVTYECATYKKSRRFYFQHAERPSDERDTAPCAHFTACGGCLLQHMKKPTYQEFKKAVVSQAFIKNGLDPFVIQDVLFVEPGQRRRVNMEATKKHDTVFLGFHRHKSHQIINLTECHTMTPEIASLLTPLRTALTEVLENFQKASIFITMSKVGLDFHFEIQGLSELTEPQRQVMKDLAQMFSMARLQFRHRKFIDVIHFQQQPVVSFDGIDVEIDAFGFLQASSKADEILTKLVMTEIDSKPHHIADLFCGRGTFTLPLARLASVSAYEFDQKSLAALDKAVLQSSRPIKTHYRNLFDEPLTTKEIKDFDIVVIDPPRAGAEAQIHQLKSSNLKKIIYISCNPETFARDAKILSEENWILEKATPVDQFYWSPHMEVVGVFTKVTH